MGIWSMALACAALAFGDAGSTGGTGGDARIREAFELLSRTGSGRELVSAARAAWKLAADDAILDRCAAGRNSRTDAILTRKLNPRTGRETRVRRLSIVLRTQQPRAALALDLAHELRHAASPPAWDPYDPELSAQKYVRASIEAPGGEVDALVAECRVAFELEAIGHLEGDEMARRCATYRNQEGSPDREKILASLYRVGVEGWRILETALAPLAVSLPLARAEPVDLVSSSGKDSYPVSLLREFDEINRAACQNSERRLASLAKGQERERETSDLIRRRCQARIFVDRHSAPEYP